jgi:transcriptional regulator with XRE-family HTH domain
MSKITPARLKWRHEVAYRLRIARKNGKFTLEEVGNKLGFGKQNVAGWESAASEMKIWDLMRAAKLYGVSTDELLTGKPAGASKLSTSSQLVPKISRNALLTLAETFAEELVEDPAALLATVTADRVAASVSDLSTSAFAFDVFDATLEPEIQYHDVVVVDRAKTPRSGQACLFYLWKTRQLCLLWYQGPQNGKKIEPPFELVGQQDNLTSPIHVTADHRPIYLGVVRQLTRTQAQSNSRTRRASSS